MTYRRKRILVSIACLVMLISVQLSCFAATYYVATTGSNTNAGTGTGTPWASINYGDSGSKLSAGDTVYVKGGTFSPSSTMVFANCPGASGSPITYLSCNSNWVPAVGAVTINCKATGSSTDSIAFTGTTIHDVVLNGFNINQGSITGSPRALLDINATSYGPTNIEVKNCTFTTSSRGCGQGVFINAGNGNLVHNNVFNGLCCYSSTYCGYGIVVSGGTNNKIYNNDLYDCGHRSSDTTATWAMSVTGADCTTLIANNIIQAGGTNTYEDGISEQSPSASLRLNNMIYNCAASYNTTTAVGYGETTAVNPLFTVPGSNWTLQSTSPAIDAGVTIYGVNQTFNGCWPEIGAFELAGDPVTLFTVTGTITDAISSAPISGATVSFGSHATAITAADGTYSLAMPAGAQTISISKTAYRTDTETITIASGTNAVSRALSQTCTASGVITSSGGGPVAGATVTLGTDSGTTDFNGDYNICTVVGTRTLTITATGYRTDTETVTLTTGTNFISRTLGQLCTVTGTITNSAGGGVSGATVDLGGGDSTTTNSGGLYTVTTITGSHTLTISKTGYNTDTEPE